MPPEQLDEEAKVMLRRLALQTGVSKALRERASVALTIRLAHWHGDFLPFPGRFKNKIPRGFASWIPMRADPIELLIVRAIAMTSTPGAAQFLVSPDGSVFTSDVYGRSLFSGRRVDVTGLSPLLDKAADIFNNQRGRVGGRFYERDGFFFKADDKIFLEVLDDNSEGLEEVKPQGPKRLWQRLMSPVLVWRRDDNENPTSQDRETALPEWVPPRRRTPNRRQHERPPEYCPIHHIELPTTGKCDECS